MKLRRRLCAMAANRFLRYRFANRNSPTLRRRRAGTRFTEHLDKIVAVVEEAFTRAEMQATDIDGIAVTVGPGLVGSLLVGVSYAKAMAFALEKPLVGVESHRGPRLFRRLWQSAG